jgi:hypothetical protein
VEETTKLGGRENLQYDDSGLLVQNGIVLVAPGVLYAGRAACARRTFTRFYQCDPLSHQHPKQVANLPQLCTRKTREEPLSHGGGGRMGGVWEIAVRCGAVRCGAVR